MKKERTWGRMRRLVLLLLAAGCMLLPAGCGSGGSDGSAAGDERSSVEQTEPARSSEAQEQLEQDLEDGYLLVVNKQHHLSENYKPEDLTSIKYYAADRSPEARYMRKKATDQFHKMVEDAAEEDIEIVITTAYRSYGFQNILFTNYVKQKGEAEANKTSARPGESEHQTGLSADLSTSEINYANSSAFGDTKAGKWVAEHCHEYGFIIRFPDGREDITGYTYEPWHIRYVGKTAAKEIYDQDITLEEFIENNDLTSAYSDEAGLDEDDSDDGDLSA